MTTGDIIRAKRLEKGLSAGDVAERLNRPITKQAFSKRERTGRFTFDMVVEIAAILDCPMSIFYAPKDTDICLCNHGVDNKPRKAG